MDSTPEARLRNRARRAYELSRVWVGLTWAAAAMATALVGAFITGAVVWCTCLGLITSAAVVAFVWSGRSLGRGVIPGLGIGTAAMFVALGGQVCVNELGGGLLACALPSALGGIAIGLMAARIGDSPRRAEVLTVWASVAGIATPLALSGCSGFGIGALGLIFGLVVGSVPTLLRLQAPA